MAVKTPTSWSSERTGAICARIASRSAESQAAPGSKGAVKVRAVVASLWPASVAITSKVVKSTGQLTLGGG